MACFSKLTERNSKMSVLCRKESFHDVPAIQNLSSNDTSKPLIRVYFQRYVQEPERFTCKWDDDFNPINLEFSYKKLKHDYSCLAYFYSDHSLMTIFKVFQQPVLNPHGEADSMFEFVAHQSMTVGDVVQVNDDVFLFTQFGFRRVLTLEEKRLEILGDLMFEPEVMNLHQYNRQVNSGLVSAVSKYYSKLFDCKFDDHRFTCLQLMSDGTLFDEVLSFKLEGATWYLSTEGLSNTLPAKFLEGMAKCNMRSLPLSEREQRFSNDAPTWFVLESLAA
jgi:hypothetical protein